LPPPRPAVRAPPRGSASRGAPQRNNSHMAQAATRNNARRDFYERIGGLSMAPLWEALHQLVPPQPAPKYQPAHWDYEKVRPFLMESGSLITAKEAVPRVLILRNPAMPGSSPTTPQPHSSRQP